MSATHPDLIPKPVLMGAAALIIGTLAFVGTIQFEKHLHHRSNSPEIAFGSPIASRQLRFVDAGDGTNAFGGHVRVFDAQTGVELPELKPDDGFIRAVLNGLAFERTKRGGIDAPPVFELTAWSGGPMTLTDIATGKRIEVSEFGADNAHKFFRFLPPPPRHSGGRMAPPVPAGRSS